MYFFLGGVVKLTGNILVDTKTVQYISRRYYLEDIAYIFKTVDLEMDIGVCNALVWGAIRHAYELF